MRVLDDDADGDEADDDDVRWYPTNAVVVVRAVAFG